MILSDLLQYGAHFRRFSEKTNDRILKYNQKCLFLDHIGPFLPNLGKTRIFPKNRAMSLFYVYKPLTSYKKSEKTNEPIPRKLRHGRTHGREFIGPCRKAGSKKKNIKTLKNYTSLQDDRIGICKICIYAKSFYSLNKSVYIKVPLHNNSPAVLTELRILYRIISELYW